MKGIYQKMSLRYGIKDFKSLRTTPRFGAAQEIGSPKRKIACQPLFLIPAFSSIGLGKGRSCRGGRNSLNKDRGKSKISAKGYNLDISFEEGGCPLNLKEPAD